jgi:hypothetical protein
MKLESVNKESLGQFAANVRRVKPPEPYLGKGIRYEGRSHPPQAGQESRLIYEKVPHSKTNSASAAMVRIRARITGTAERPRLTVFQEQSFRIRTAYR